MGVIKLMIACLLLKKTVDTHASPIVCHDPTLRRIILLRAGGDAVFDGLSSIPDENVASSIIEADIEPSGNQQFDKKTKGLERGKLLPSNFSLKDMFQAYRDIQSDYQSKAFSNPLNYDNPREWEILTEKDDIEVSLLKHSSDPTCPYVRMRAVIPVPVEHCWNFLKVSEWDRSMPKMDPFYEGVSIFGNYTYTDEDGRGSHNMILCRKRTGRIFAYGKRDLVFLSVTQNEPEPDGTWVSGTVSVICDHLLPREKGYTRAFQDSIAFYKPVAGNSKT
jgi:hypothetical protein